MDPPRVSHWACCIKREIVICQSIIVMFAYRLGYLQVLGSTIMSCERCCCFFFGSNDLDPPSFQRKCITWNVSWFFFLDPGIDLSCSVLKQQHTISLPFHIWWPVCRFTSGPQIDMTKRLMDFNGPCCVWCFILSECPLVCIDWLSIGLGIVFAWMIVHWSSGVAHLGSTWDGAACGMLKDLLPVTTHKFKTGHRTVQTCRMPPSKRPAGHGVTDSVAFVSDLHFFEAQILNIVELMQYVFMTWTFIKFSVDFILIPSLNSVKPGLSIF